MDREERSRRAEALLADELLRELIEKIRGDALHGFEFSGFPDQDARNHAHAKLWALRQIVAELENLRHAGKPKK